MMQGSYEMLLSDIAVLLAGNQFDTEAVSKSLRLICDSFSFTYGAVYEADNSEHFNLMENVALNQAALCQRFSVKELTTEQCSYLTKKTVSYITRNEHNTLCETKLLNMFGATSLVIAPVTDESFCIYGLIVFFDTASEERCTEAAQETLSVMLPMLVRYIGVRMYRYMLSRSQASLENILDNTGIDIYVNDFYTHDILYVNRSMAEPYGGQGQFLGRKCWEVLFPGQNGPCDFCPEKYLIDDQGEPTRVYTWDYQRPFDGSWFRVFSAAFQWVDGRLAHVVSSADITDNKEKEALIQYMANYDSLTNLPNRRMLVNDCKKRIDLASDTEKGYLLFFDIDGFKNVNDNFGHDAGDELLIALGKFFSGIPLLKDSIYRNGGDEFVAIIGGESITKENIQNLTRFILARFRKPWILKAGSIHCNTSIGVACFPEDGRTAEELLRKADMSMYQVKKSGGGGVCFGYQLL